MNDRPHKTAAELQAKGLPHAGPEAFGELPAGTVYADEPAGSVADHAARFLPPTPDQAQPCPACGGLHLRWAIQHGVARCESCGWPARSYHYFRVPGEERDRRVDVTLWFHPDEIRDRPPAKRNGG